MLLTAPAGYADNGSYNSFLRDDSGKPVPAPYTYTPLRVISGTSLGTTNMVTPSDMYVTKDDMVYILDSGNKRILKLDKELRLIGELREYKDLWGNAVEFKKMTGLHVSDTGDILVTDAELGMLSIISPEGVLKKRIGKPVTDLLPDDFVYKPDKVLMDDKNIIYVLATGLYQGAVTIDGEGKFLGFYGASPVEVTAALRFDYFWKKIFNKTQRGNLASYVPTEYKNFCVDREGFIYTVTSVSEFDTNLIRRFNPKGMDILTPVNPYYGDYKKVQYLNESIKTSFVDVAVNKEGLVAALDQTRCRIFEYDEDMTLIGTFGAKGHQAGTFLAPVAINYLEDRLLVLDSQKGTLTEFGLTNYGRNMHDAIFYYSDGQYQKALAPWKEVLRQNVNADIAYTGIGKALYGLRQYKQAMEYFKLGYSRENYSKAFREYRSQFLREHFLPVAAAVLLVLGLGFYLSWYRRRKHRYDDSVKEVKWYLYCFRIMERPFGGFEELRMSKKKSFKLAAFIVALWWVAEILSRQYAGFSFNSVKREDINILFLLAGTAGLFLVWAISNWAVGTLSDGSGKFVDIFIFSAYALTPFILSKYTNLILSNILVREESILMSLVSAVGIAYTALLLINAVMTVHEYTFGKSVISCLLSILGIAAVLFVLLLLFNLMQQFVMLVRDIFTEINLRL